MHIYKFRKAKVAIIFNGMQGATFYLGEMSLSIKNLFFILFVKPEVKN